MNYAEKYRPLVFGEGVYMVGFLELDYGYVRGKTGILHILHQIFSIIT